MALFDRSDRENRQEPKTPAPELPAGPKAAASRPTVDPKAPRYPSSGAPRRDQSALIGPDLEVVGEVRGDEDLILDGLVKGKLTLGKHQLLIGEAGRAEADVSARRVVIYGELIGNVEADEAIELGHTARVQGHLRTPVLRIDEGAILNGRVEMGSAKAGESVAQASAGKKKTNGAGAAAPKSAAPAQP